MMVSHRLIPTDFFRDPSITTLRHESQLVLIGLLLLADDEGQGMAHALFLGQELDYPADTIEQALEELAEHDLVKLWQAGRLRYYGLPRWQAWQTEITEDSHEDGGASWHEHDVYHPHY